jgi:hypothetical protein
VAQCDTLECNSKWRSYDDRGKITGKFDPDWRWTIVRHNHHRHWDAGTSLAVMHLGVDVGSHHQRHAIVPQHGPENDDISSKFAAWGGFYTVIIGFIPRRHVKAKIILWPLKNETLPSMPNW